MWLPTKVYERIPHFLLAVGIIFLATAVYLSTAYPKFTLYFGAGVVCIVWAAALLVIRARHRRKTESSELQEAD
jgi:membrane protein implicated in regulation of membrane protease activity